MASCGYRELKAALDHKYPGVRSSRGEIQYRRDPALSSVPDRVSLPQKHGSEIKGGTAGNIRRQLGLTAGQFVRFVDCSMSREEYIALFA